MTLDAQRQELLGDVRTKLSQLPPRPDLDIEVLRKDLRSDGDKFAGLENTRCFEEWRIEYLAESPETMPIQAGQRVPAYLLIPKSERWKPPYPAAVCFHQCNVDCVLGKEAVVGKAPSRPDQAYGYELVNHGFVVLAPDSINCGQRNIPSIRKENEHVICHGELARELSDYPYKGVLDDLRAVDLLESLDFVDSSRIAAVGHSMGSLDVLSAMAHDNRVKAGIISGVPDHLQNLPLLSPRLLVALQGSLDGSVDSVQRKRDAFERAREFYEADGKPDNLILRTPNCGHHFLDVFRWEAYMRLKEHFGIPDGKERKSLVQILNSARQSAIWLWGDQPTQFPEVEAASPCYVSANEQDLIGAFYSLLLHLFSKENQPPLKATIEERPTGYRIVFAIPSKTPEQNADARVSHEISDQVFFEHAATLARSTGSQEIQYEVTFKKADQ